MDMKRLFLVLGILCVMAATSANVWITQQEAEIQAVLSWAPSSGMPAPTQFEQARHTVMQANIPVYRTTVSAFSVTGWILIGGSLLMIIFTALQPHRRHS